METISHFLGKEGIGDKKSQKNWFKNNRVKLNNSVVNQEETLTPGDILSIGNRQYIIKKTTEEGRLSYNIANENAQKKINGRIRVHCGYHKCLTMFFRRLSQRTVRWQNPINGNFRHFFHRKDEFYHDCHNFTLNSISGHCLDLDRFNDIRVVHIIRDPRDLLVSGYFYHKRAVESWCNYINPTDEDWSVVNGHVPAVLPRNISFSDYLHNYSLEEGLLAEIEFRRNHYETMRAWPTDDPRILTIRYEDLLGNEEETLTKIYSFYGFAPQTRLAAGWYAKRYSAEKQKQKNSHIRNPGFGQWRENFSSAVIQEFEEKYSDLLSKYHY